MAAALLAFAGVTSAHAQQKPNWPETALTAHRDSFVIIVQGQQRGSSVFTVHTKGDSAHIVEKTVMGTMGKQDSEIFTDLHGHLRSVTQASSFGGQQAMLNVAYQNGHAKGLSLSPGQPQPAQVDALVPADAVDDNAFQALLPGLPWKLGAKWEFPVFSAQNNSVTSQTLTVEGVEKVTVPSGTFEAYRAVLQAAIPVTFWVNRAVPHRVLKVAPNGQPFSMELAN
jgi:hypothetical protein